MSARTLLAALRGPFVSEDTLAIAFLDAARRRLERSTAKIVHCVNQLDDAQIWWRPTRAQNSIGILIVHLCGNVTQWIISGVGGVPDVRDRPREFVDDTQRSKSQLLEALNRCIVEAGNILASADTSQLLSPCRIQGFDTTPMSGILETVAHFQGHVQEIISLTRQQLGDAYEFHWIPSTLEEMSEK